MDPFKDPKFKKLKAQWYKKLEKSGFDDIEDHNYPDDPLRCYHALDFKKVSPEKYEQVTKYYENARQLLFTYKFPNDSIRRIWELYVEGTTVREIEKQVRKYKKTRIAEIINEIIQCQMPK